MSFGDLIDEVALASPARDDCGDIWRRTAGVDNPGSTRLSYRTIAHSLETRGGEQSVAAQQVSSRASTARGRL